MKEYIVKVPCFYYKNIMADSQAEAFDYIRNKLENDEVKSSELIIEEEPFWGLSTFDKLKWEKDKTQIEKIDNKNRKEKAKKYYEEKERIRNERIEKGIIERED